MWQSSLVVQAQSAPEKKGPAHFATMTLACQKDRMSANSPRTAPCLLLWLCSAIFGLGYSLCGCLQHPGIWCVCATTASDITAPQYTHTQQQHPQAVLLSFGLSVGGCELGLELRLPHDAACQSQHITRRLRVLSLPTTRTCMDELVTCMSWPTRAWYSMGLTPQYSSGVLTPLQCNGPDTVSHKLVHTARRPTPPTTTTNVR